jgi:integration host factor subunit alpha
MFCKFCIREEKESMGRNPAMDEDMMLENRKIIMFKCFGKLRDRING